MLILRPEAAFALRHFAQEAYPDECCGLLAGRQIGQARIVEALYPLPNRSARLRRRESFVIDSVCLETAKKAAEAAGGTVFGLYHSHPDREAHPSEADRQGALPGLSYVITSVRKGMAGNTFCWQLEAETAILVREDMVVSGE